MHMNTIDEDTCTAKKIFLLLTNNENRVPLLTEDVSERINLCCFSKLL